MAPRIVELDIIEEARRSAKITITRLCREADIASSTYIRGLKGEVSPNLRTLSKLRTGLARITLGLSQQPGQIGPGGQDASDRRAA